MLSGVFYDIYNAFGNLAYQFLLIADWFYDQGWPWSYLGAPFDLLKDACRTIKNFFYDCYTFTKTIETQLDDAWSKAKQVFDYAYDVLTAKVNDALNDAADAWDYAADAFSRAQNVWNYAYNYLTDLAREAWDRAGNIWGSVTNFLEQQATDAYNKAVWAYEQIEAAVMTKAQEIYAWVKTIPAEIKDYIDGVVTAIGAVTTDIVQSMIALALAAIAGPINLVNLWFDDIQSFFTSPLDWLEARLGDWFLGKEE